MNLPEPTRSFPDASSVHAYSGVTGPGRGVVRETAGDRGRSLVEPARVPSSFPLPPYGSRTRGK